MLVRGARCTPHMHVECSAKSGASKPFESSLLLQQNIGCREHAVWELMAEQRSGDMSAAPGSSAHRGRKGFRPLCRRRAAGEHRETPFSAFLPPLVARFVADIKQHETAHVASFCRMLSMVRAPRQAC